MPEPLLTFFKYLFLAVLYLFFLRVLRAVWIELREPKAAAAEPVPVAAEASPTVASAHHAPGDGAGPRLVVRSPTGVVGPAFDLVGETTVGRSPGCGVALPEDTFVSQIHARVFRRDGTAWVEDLGSTNGTWVNDHRLDAPVPLHPGDRLRVGQTDLELQP